MAISCLIKAFLFATAISLVLGQGASDCTIDSDVGFILDSSGSIAKQYANEKKFLNRIAASFGVGTGKSRASVITFSFYSELSIKFNDFDTLKDFQDAVMKIPLMGYTTYMDRALRLAQTEMFTAANGARAGKARLVIMLTDGEQTTSEKYEDPALVVSEMRSKYGINVLVIGMGRRIKTKSVINIAGGPQYAFSVKGFKKLAKPDFLSSVKSTACDAAEESLGFEYAGLVTTPAPAGVCPDVDADYQGNDIKLDLDVASWEDCSGNCKANAACKYFTFVLESGCCYHKTDKGAVTKTPGLISGSKNCPA